MPKAPRKVFQWCHLREGRVATETCKHQAYVEGELACLRCLQRDLFSAEPGRARPRGSRKG